MNKKYIIYNLKCFKYKIHNIACVLGGDCWKEFFLSFNKLRCYLKVFVLLNCLVE